MPSSQQPSLFIVRGIFFLLFLTTTTIFIIIVVVYATAAREYHVGGKSYI